MRTRTILGASAVALAALLALAPERETTRVSADLARVTKPAGGPKTVAKPVREFVAPWGTALGEVSRRNPAEGSPEAPMSFAVDDAGRVHVLDQVAARIVTFDGGVATSATPIGLDTAQDLDVDAKGTFVVLDRLVDRAVRFVEPSTGALLARVPIEGLGVPDAGGVTAVFARDDGAWIEVEHGRTIRVARADGSPDVARIHVPGRFAPNDRFVRAERVAGDVVVRSHARTGGAGTLHARVAHPSPAVAITGLDVDASGRTFLSSWRLDRTGATAIERHVAVLLDPSGAELARTELPASSRAEETFRAVKLGRDGALHAMVVTDAGVELWRWAP